MLGGLQLQLYRCRFKIVLCARCCLLSCKLLRPTQARGSLEGWSRWSGPPHLFTGAGWTGACPALTIGQARLAAMLLWLAWGRGGLIASWHAPASSISNCQLKRISCHPLCSGCRSFSYRIWHQETIILVRSEPVADGDREHTLLHGVTMCHAAKPR